jgi:hypothetical protein
LRFLVGALIAIGLASCAAPKTDVVASTDPSYCHLDSNDPVCDHVPYRRCRYLQTSIINDADAACQWPVWPPRRRNYE